MLRSCRTSFSMTPRMRFRSKIDESVTAHCSTALAARAGQMLRPLVNKPLLDEFWPLARAGADDTDNLGALPGLRRGTNSKAGGESRRSSSRKARSVSWSRFIGSPPIYWRICRGVCEKSTTRPWRGSHRAPTICAAPTIPCNLARDGEWLEAPFWVWTANAPHRHRMFACRRGATVVLADRTGWQLELPLSPDGDATAAASILAEFARWLKSSSRRSSKRVSPRSPSCA